MRTIRHKSGAIEYVPSIEEVRAQRARVAMIAELARAIRSIAAVVPPVATMAEGERTEPVPKKFLAEKELERLEQLEKKVDRLTRVSGARTVKGRA